VHPSPSRAEWERLADSMLLAVRPWATDTHALIHLPGPVSHSGRWSDGLEGYARTFLLAAFRLAGAKGDDPHRIAEWYARGLAAGVDPVNPDRWPRFGECGQAKVEAASIALGLHLTRPWLWDRLSSRTQQRLLDWLAPMVGDAMPANNWVWFQAVTGAFAKEYQDTTATLKATAQKEQAVVQAQVSSVGVIESTGDRVELLVYLDQYRRNTNISGEKVDQNRVVLTMVRVAGGWKVAAASAI